MPRRPMPWIPLLLLLLLSSRAGAGDEGGGGAPEAPFWDYRELPPEEEAGLLERGVGSLLSTTHRIGHWLDRALGGESLEAPPTRTRMRFTLWRYDEGGGRYDDTQARFNLRMRLPRLERRLSLFLTNDLDEGLATSSTGAVFPRETLPEETYLGVNVLPPLRDRIPGLRGRAGARVKGGDLALFVEPRHVWQADFPVWSVTTQARLRYSTLQGWDASFVANLDRALSTGDRYLRLNGEVRWSEESEPERGAEYFLRVMRLHRLSSRQSLIYEWNNHLVSRPSGRLDASTLVMRYRRRLWRPWLFLEVAPQVVFREELEYDPSAALLIKLEMLIQRSDR